ncbi:hypothetical protein ACFYT3_05500 [Nocardia amikacinitolerans]|nr:hypothetical protein [Nocardia amikacinitolerans]MCP2288774.1 hypothetical protein [Nocardia amikacinitolerans]
MARLADPRVRTRGRGVSTVITELGVLSAGPTAVSPGVEVVDVVALDRLA